MGKKDIFFLLILLAAMVTGFVISLDYPYRARFFPMIIISLCGILILVELVRAFITGIKAGSAESGDQEDAEAMSTNSRQAQRFLLTLAWVGGFALLLWLFGFFVGLPLFIFAYVKMHGEKWRWAIILPATMFVIVYVGFGLLLKSPLYEGLLFLQ